MSATKNLQDWVEQVERTVLAGKTLTAAMKLFDSGGSDAQVAWEVVEKAREAYVTAYRREAKRWQRVVGDAGGEGDEQPDLPGVERPGPKGKKGESKGPKLLGPASSANEA